MQVLCREEEEEGEAPRCSPDGTFLHTSIPASAAPHPYPRRRLHSPTALN